jgi:serine/threonine protein phosphatase 1
VYAIGDIHGRKDLLERLIETIKHHGGGTDYELIFLGDYVDRGPDSAGVVDYLIQSETLQDVDCTFLKGNHEATLLDFLDTPEVGASWSTYGGLETLLSYGVQDIELSKDEARWAATSQRFREHLPAAHLEFYKALKSFTTRGDYIFVHAGIDPGKPLSEQTDADFLWIRDAFLSDTRQYDYMVVHGHTPQSEPSKDNRRIGLDTGAYQTGVLTAAAISATGVEFISTR